MARFRLFLMLVFCSAISALAASLLLGATLALLTGGPLAILSGLLLGLMGLPYSIALTLPAALLLGSLLCLCRVRLRVVWACTGALAGLAGYALVSAVPGTLRETMLDVVGQDRIAFGLACATGGALAALLFRTMMRAFTAYDEALTST